MASCVLKSPRFWVTKYREHRMKTHGESIECESFCSLIANAFWVKCATCSHACSAEIDVDGMLDLLNKRDFVQPQEFKVWFV